MAGTPATKGEEITRGVNQLWEDLTARGMRLDEFKWRRLFNDAEKLSKTREDGERGLQLQAILQGLRRDLSAAESLFRQSAGRYGKTRTWYIHRAAIAPYLAQPGMVVDMIENDYPSGDPLGLTTLVNSCSQTGLYVTARRAMRELEAIAPEGGEIQLFVNKTETQAAARYLTDHGIDERIVADRIQVSQEVVEKHFNVSNMKMEAGDFGILFQYIHDADAETLIAIDQEISRELCARFEDTLSDHLTIEVSPKD
ncbi:hypothetical protein SB18R_03310 [Pseudomonas oryzihabitans]|nr:hypothetical protein SB9_12545 [Pseudomonas psychrotolerans]KTT78271.1 hypothetical protein SB18R_03310 [Pseudomonas psychrotolerans]